MPSENPPPNEPAAAPVSSSISSPTDRRKFFGLLRLRACWLPTFRGWLLLFVCLLVFLGLVVPSLHSFLAVNTPISDGFLVVEGWMPDYGMEQAVEEFKRDHYQTIYVTGGPLEYGMYLAQYQTYAQLGAATLLKLGLGTNAVRAVPAPLVRQDRTYTSAVALKHWLLAHDLKPERIHLITDGPHARRSRLLYEKAMGPGVLIGVTAIAPRDYDEKQWWRYSAGVRGVIGEGLAYLYARFLFFPPKDP